MSQTFTCPEGHPFVGPTGSRPECPVCHPPAGLRADDAMTMEDLERMKRLGETGAYGRMWGTLYGDLLEWCAAQDLTTLERRAYQRLRLRMDELAKDEILKLRPHGGPPAGVL